MSVGQWHLIMPFRLLKHLERIESPSPAPFRLSVDSCFVPSLFVCFNLPALPLHISPPHPFQFCFSHPFLPLCSSRALVFANPCVDSFISNSHVFHQCHAFACGDGLHRAMDSRMFLGICCSSARTRGEPQQGQPTGFQAVPALNP